MEFRYFEKKMEGSDMKIGFDVSQAGSAKAGCGYVANNLIQQLALLDSENRYLLYRLWGDEFHDPLYRKITPVKSNARMRYEDRGSFKAEKNFWSKKQENFTSSSEMPDIIHSNNFFCPNYKLKNIQLVYTLYDLSFVQCPEHTTEANRLICLKGLFNASLYSDHIVSISEYSKKDFLNTFPYYPEENITVIPLGARFSMALKDSPPIFKGSELMPNQFILSVGTLEPRKNQLGLIKAYKALKDEGVLEGIPLVLAGQSGWLAEPINEFIIKFGLERDVIKLGRVDDKMLAWLYRHCLFLAYPSFFEGFGLPILEAMSMGAAVISSNTSSMPEVVGDAALLINPYEVDELVQAMRYLILDKSKRDHLKMLSLKRSELFSWDKAACAVLEVYNNLYLEKSR